MTDYTFYKLSFQTGVHLGSGMLNSSEIMFRSDTLFSALYIEALKHHCEEAFYAMCAGGSLRFTDAFPYDGERYYLPKPMLRIETADTGNSLEKKFYKSLKYIPVDKYEDYLQGKMALVDDTKGLATLSTRTMARIQEDDDTLPYQVGICSFKKDAGLYFIAVSGDEKEKMLLGDLLESLSRTGIGGKRSSGLGKFTVNTGGRQERLIRRLKERDGLKVLLNTALPREEEMESAIEGASFNVIPRSGFVSSDAYSHDHKKHTLYAFEAGSCFKNAFEGDIYDVSRGNLHPVYRYAKPVFMSIAGEV